MLKNRQSSSFFLCKNINPVTGLWRLYKAVILGKNKTKGEKYAYGRRTSCTGGSSYNVCGIRGGSWYLFGNGDAGYTQNMGLNEEDYGVTSSVAEKAEKIQEKTAFLPGYAFAEDSENPAWGSFLGRLLQWTND